MRLVILTLLLCFLMPLYAMAADIAVYPRQGYDRVVMEGVVVTVVSESNTNLVIKTDTPIDLQSGFRKTPAVQSVVNKDGQSEIIFAKGVTKTRNFKIGKRFILDVFFDRTAVVEQAPAVQPAKDVVPEPKPETKPTSEQTPTATPEEPSNDVRFMDVIENQWESFLNGMDLPEVAEDATPTDEKLHEVDEETPKASMLDSIPPEAQPTIITVSSTTPFNMAVFKRYDRLIMIADTAQIALPPQIEGMGATLKWELTEIPMDDVKAWMMLLPQNAYIRPEGGGMVWRFIVSDQDPELSSADFRRRMDDKNNPAVDVMIANATKIIRFPDPDYGDDLAVFTVTGADSRMTVPLDYIDFDVIPAVTGVVVKPQSDGVRVLLNEGYVTIEKRDGLIVAEKPQDDVADAYLNPQFEGDPAENFNLSKSRIFYFNDWGADTPFDDLLDRRQELDLSLSVMEDDQKPQAILALAKFFLSQSMGQEALGYLKFVSDVNPEIGKSPEYKALKGAAHFLARQYDLSAAMFDDETLNKNKESRLWRSAAFARQDMQDEALALYTDDAVEMTREYPFAIQMQILPPIIRMMINTRRGERALEIAEILEAEDEENLSTEEFATIAYLKGLAQKISGFPEKAMASLSKASLSDKLGPYGIQSEMMLVDDGVKRETLPLPDAIKRMERLRFAWRGDDLETQIYQKLGRLYIDNNQPQQGLNILKRAAETTKSVKERRDTVRAMSTAYNELFVGEGFEALDPVEAITIYDEFKELTPVGEQGNKIIDRLADKLMDIGLLSRAVSVLQDKMERLGEGEHAIKTGLRIAAIHLLDRQPLAAQETLKKVDEMIADYRGDNKNDLNEKIVLLKARALSDSGDVDDALFIMDALPDTDDVLRLRVDTAWRAGRWLSVSDSLDKLIQREDITVAAPPTQEQSQMILNQSIALSLSEQYDALARFTARYDRAMSQSPTYKTFQLVTRPSSTATLADRQTLLDLTSEVDLFSGFLESTKAQ